MTLNSSNTLTSSISDAMKSVVDLPNGARFYRCALQINPFAYLQRFNKQNPFQSEEEYNDAIIKTCTEVGIEVIAVTDHFEVKHSINLVKAARKAGIHAFNGFEAVTKDGVHFLCLFDKDRDDEFERYIGECGISKTSEKSPLGKKDSIELLECVKNWGAVCIAAHAISNGGLLKKLSGRSRVEAWKNPNLLACALPGQVSDDVPIKYRRILENKDFEHKRERPIAILNASDVSDPAILKCDKSSCFIKMSEISVEALRQAFLDPTSRVRLHSDPEPKRHSEIIAIAWEGGFLNDTAVHFNENLNVLVGGRGTGKSTIIESIRYALDLEPIGDETQKTHESIIKGVLKSGTKVSLLIRSHKPSIRKYTIERAVPNPPVVKDEDGVVMDILPQDLIPGVEIYGQHEISELAKDSKKRTLMLKRFIERDHSLSGRKSDVKLELERIRIRILNVHSEMSNIEDRLAEIPVLNEMQKRYQESGLEEKLKEKSLLVREESLFTNLVERTSQYRNLYNSLAQDLPVNTTFISNKALGGLPNADVLSEIEGILNKLSGKLQTLCDQFHKILDEAEYAIQNTKLRWTERKTSMEETYEKSLRELQKLSIDGTEFIKMHQKIEELRPLVNRMNNLKSDLKLYDTQRQSLLKEWNGIKKKEFEQLERAAKRVSRKLANRVRVKVKFAGDRDPLVVLLRDEIGGNLSSTINRIQKINSFQLQDFIEKCRLGKEALIDHYKLTQGAAERISKASPEILMRIEELELPAVTEIELNTALEEESPKWQNLDTLSTGQMATAVLFLLLLESDAPLVIDQPEDDLDNRFITEGVVPIMRQEKRQRQFIFSTHNANIPVLGDAELILGLTAYGITTEGKARISQEHMASIDSEPVRKLVEEVLEGGKAAFDMRRSKYGF